MNKFFLHTNNLWTISFYLFKLFSKFNSWSLIFYGHNIRKKYIENIFIENGNTMFSLQYKKTKDKSKQRGNQFRKPMNFIVVFSYKRWMEIQKKKRHIIRRNKLLLMVYIESLKYNIQYNIWGKLYFSTDCKLIF